MQPGELALDVEVADLVEVEKPLIPVRHGVHAPAMNIVGEMIDNGQPGARRAWVALARPTKSTSQIEPLSP